jgi:hypothetical protein
MLRAVGVDGTLVLAVRRVPQLVHVVVLHTLESVTNVSQVFVKRERRAERGRESCGSLPIQKDATETLVEVLTEARDGLLQDVH